VGARHIPPALDKLTHLLARLPGIGERTAARLSLFVVSQPESYAQGLAAALGDVVEHVSLCPHCHMLAEHGEPCALCRDPARGQGLLCVVETVQDLLAFERAGAYDGRYHVLHGALAPLRGVGPQQLKLDNLEERIAQEGVREVILATSTDVEGEATALYLARRLQPTGVEISRIATGVPMGGDLEYIDRGTLGRALQGRRIMELDDA